MTSTRRKFRNQINVQRIHPPIDCEILALNEAQSPKLTEHRDSRWRNAWNGGQAPNAIGPPRFLRQRSERPCDTRAHKRDKLAPPHRHPPHPKTSTNVRLYHFLNDVGRVTRCRTDVAFGSSRFHTS